MLNSLIVKIQDGGCRHIEGANAYASLSAPPNFYRATRMHSADYAVARCPSVRLSHAGIVSKRLYKVHILIFFTTG